ncbi:MAG: pyridoxamine 5'-phosphate oxidase family protein [Bacteroidales bacterium]|nr:pyridoxamine 5'-phosphate oxidase family protein [Bacteroidales bacterium]
MNHETIKKAEQIIADRTVKNRKYNNEICVLTLIDENGYPYSTVITPGRSDGLTTLWFGTNAESKKLGYIEKNNKASVCFPSETYNITLIGEVEVLEATDENKQNVMWYDGLDHTNSSKIIIFKTKCYSIFLVTEEDGIAEGEL